MKSLGECAEPVSGLQEPADEAAGFMGFLLSSQDLKIFSIK
jgi:hypothetical protein